MNAPLSGKYAAYTNAKASTVSRSKQIVLLYEGIIKFIQQAKHCINENNIEGRFNALTKAAEVISGLQNGIDFDKGGDVAHVLYQFYSDILYSINQVQKTNDIALCDDAIYQLKVMLESWKEVDEQTKVPAASSGSQSYSAQSSGTSSKPGTSGSITVSA